MNGLKTIRIWDRVAVVLLLALTFICAGKSASCKADIATEIEKAVGRQLADLEKSSDGVEADPLLLGYVRHIGEIVSKQSPRREVNYEFSIPRTDVANAFALPGGYIFVTRGLLDEVDSDDELATVLAHECGHVARKHAQKQIGANIAFLAAMAVLHGSKYDKLRTGATVLNILATLARSRAMEAEADEVGIGFASAAGYDPRGLVNFFERLDRREPSQIERYFDTHPSPSSRIAQADKNPLVARPTAELRENMAKGYADRGYPGEAAVAGSGGDALAFPPTPPLPEAFTGERVEVAGKAEAIRKALGPAAGFQHAGGILQQVLLINSQPTDIRWVYLAARAYAVQADVDGMFSRTLRVARVGPGVFDALSGYRAMRPPGDPLIAEAELGCNEVRSGLEKDAGAPIALRRASAAVTTVLTDLNNRFYRLSNDATWLRYAALEGTLRYAESELARADRESGVAWRLVSVARVRRYQARLNELVPQNDAARRSLWYDLARRRFGASFDDEGPTGDVSVRAALAIELGVKTEEIGTGRDAPWAQWIMTKHGSPENVATAIRLLTLDLERETAAEDRERTTSKNPANPVGDRARGISGIASKRIASVEYRGQ